MARSVAGPPDDPHRATVRVPADPAWHDPGVAAGTAAGEPPRAPRPGRRRGGSAGASLAAAWLTLLVVSIGYGWVVAHTRPFTWGSTLATFGTVVPLGLVAWWQRRPGVPAVLRRHRSQTGLLRRTWPWGVLAGAVLALELVELFQSPRRLHPTISSLVNPELVGAGHRWVAATVWVAVSCWLVTR